MEASARSSCRPTRTAIFMSSTALTGEFISAEPMGPAELGKRHRSQNRPAENQSGSVLRLQHGVSITPVQMHNTSQMAFNPAAGLVYVPINVSGGTLNFIAAEQYAPTPGSQNFGIRLGAQVTYAKPPSIGPEREPAGRQEHSQCMGSRHAEGTMVCGRRRQSIRRCRLDRSQPGVSGYATGTPARLHGGQRREVAGSRHWRNGGTRTANHLCA